MVGHGHSHLFNELRGEKIRDLLQEKRERRRQGRPPSETLAFSPKQPTPSAHKTLGNGGVDACAM